MLNRPQWPHTIEDIIHSLDGVWGLVGATGANGNLFRLERSLHEPITYILTEYRGNEEEEIIGKRVYESQEKPRAIDDFALALGFSPRD